MLTYIESNLLKDQQQGLLTDAQQGSLCTASTISSSLALTAPATAMIAEAPHTEVPHASSITIAPVSLHSPVVRFRLLLSSHLEPISQMKQML